MFKYWKQETTKVSIPMEYTVVKVLTYLARVRRHGLSLTSL
jgi:macrodomain Ter protein organizer (MatP/YcbG family)